MSFHNWSIHDSQSAPPSQPAQPPTPLQTRSQSATSPQPPPFSQNSMSAQLAAALSSPTTRSVPRSPASSHGNGSPASHVPEPQSGAQGLTHEVAPQPRLPNADSQFASAFLPQNSSPTLRIQIHPRPRMCPAPSDEDLEAAQLIQCESVPQVDMASNPVHPIVNLTHGSQLLSGTSVDPCYAPNSVAPGPSHPQGERLSQPLDLTKDSQSLEPTNDSQPTLYSQVPGPSFAGYLVVTTSMGETMLFIEIPSSPAATLNLVTPHTSVPPAKSSAPSPNPQSRAQKGKGIAPGEKRLKLPAKKRSATGNREGLKKHQRTSKHAKGAASALSESDRAELDIPMDDFDDEQEDEGKGEGVSDGEGEDTTAGKASGTHSQRLSPELKHQMLSWYFSPELYNGHKNNHLKAHKELRTIIRDALGDKQIRNFLEHEYGRYKMYYQIVMKTGGGKDDFATKEEMKSHYKALNVEHTFDYWMRYGESEEFHVIHKVAWDSEDVRKFRHLDSITSTVSDDEATSHASRDDHEPSSSKHKARGGKKGAKAADVDSGSETEHGPSVVRTTRSKQGDLPMISVIMKGMDGLTITWDRQTDISWKLYDLEVRKVQSQEDAQREQHTLDTRSRLISDFVQLSGQISHPDHLVSSVAQQMLVKLGQDIGSLPGSAAPAAPAAAQPPSVVNLDDQGAPPPINPPSEPVASSSVSSASSSAQ
ncbi:hypothetical protein FRC10_004732 [Ceratobasidium sp. 414]|nr:hypothetical protein FRC10_004732 [Ceratobasidium sp. 414]